MSISFEGRVAIVTGAGGGLGRAYALELARRGAKVVVNDLGASRDGTGHSDAALKVVEEIQAAGGEAMSNGGSVTEYEQMAEMVARAKERWGGVHVLINNAGILRDKTFAKMDLSDFRKVVEVHLMGSATVAHTVWPIMREQKYGRIVMTSSASGIYGNFGQSNYGAAKMGVVGLMNVLALEGARDNIRVNTLAPTAATRMTEDLLPPEALEVLQPETITPGLLYLVSDDAPTRVILGAGAGVFAQSRIYETPGVLLEGADNTPEGVAASFGAIHDGTGQRELPDAFAQTRKFARKAAEACGLVLPWGED